MYYNGALPAPRNTHQTDFFGVTIYPNDWVVRIDGNHSYHNYGDVFQVQEVAGDLLRFTNNTAGDAICYVRLRALP